MITLRHGGRLKEATSDGTSTNCIYIGTLEEMQNFFATLEIGEWNDELEGKVKTKRIQQDDGTFWVVEVSCATSREGDYAEGPDTSYGKKSASLQGSLLSLDLSFAEGYRTCWNYALYCAPGYGKPSWWSTAKTTELSDADAQNYAWAKVGEERSDARGKWKCIAPIKPGVESIDYATYSVTESARFSNERKAGQFCNEMLNRIGSPDNTFGLKGEWKCDDAAVSWSGEYWLATLTWTRAGGAKKAWDKDLYD